MSLRTKKLIQKPSKEYLLNIYQIENLTLKKIAQKFNVGPTTVGRWFSFYQIPRKNSSHCHRKYPLDENFFSSLNTEAKAYYFGLLLGDGSNRLSNNQITISVQERDKHILETFCEVLQTNRPLYFRNTGRLGPNTQDQYVLTIINKKMSGDLLKHGMMQNKTLDLKFPSTVPNHLMHHFIRGVFDSDGSIFATKSNYGTAHKEFRFSIISTVSMLNGIRDELMKNINLRITKYGDQSTKNIQIKKVVKTIRFGGNHQIVLIGKYLYRDATIYLTRKKAKFDSIVLMKHPVNTHLYDKK